MFLEFKKFYFHRIEKEKDEKDEFYRKSFGKLIVNIFSYLE